MTAEIDSSDDTKPRLLAALCRHIVAVTWVDVNTEARRVKIGKNERAPEALAFSAFVISIQGIWFLVTAGHVIRQLKRRLEDGRRIVTARLMDGFSTASALPPIPFPLIETPHWHIDKEGFDYALFPLRPAYARPLMAGGVLALDEEGWANAPETADAYFLLGFPAEVTKTSVIENTRHGNASFQLGTPLLQVEPVKDPPETFRYQPNRFFAHVPVFACDAEDEKTVKDIKGMSGGPVFGVQFTNTGMLRYWVVAVQSRWREDSRIIAACPIEPLADAIKKSLSDHAAGVESHDLPASGRPDKGRKRVEKREVNGSLSLSTSRGKKMASSDNCRFSPDLHRDLTVKAAAGKLPESALERVARANAHRDRYPLNSRLHFDNCTFGEGVDYIDQQWQIIQTHNDRLSNKSLDAFGRLLHAVQDFYSHSNWVELFQGESPIPVWDLSVASLPNEIASGTWRRGRPRKCRPGALSHEDLNKDAPDTPEGAKKVETGPNAGKTMYELAWDSALRATQAQFTRFVGSTKRAGKLRRKT